MKTRQIILTSLVAIALTLPVHAQIWSDSTANSETWSNSANWYTGSVPANNGSAPVVFTELSPQPDAVSIIDAPWDIQSLSFFETAPSYQIEGDALTIEAGGITDNSSSTQYIQVPITLGAAQTWTLGVDGSNNPSILQVSGGSVTNNGNTLTITGLGSLTLPQFNGTGGLTMDGTGTVTLGSTTETGSNYSGATIINSGTLSVVNYLNSPAPVDNNFLGTSAITLGGGTLQFLVNGSDTLTAANNVTVTADSNLSVGSYTAGHGGNAIVLGTLAIGSNTLNITTNSSNISNYSVEFGATTVTGNATFSSYNTDGYATHVTLDSLNVGANSVAVSSSGNLVLTTGSVSLTGGSVSSDDTLFLAGDVTTIASATTAVISAPTINLGSSGYGINVISGQGAGVFNIASGTTPSGIDLNVIGSIGSSTPIVKNGLGTLEFSAPNFGNFLDLTVNAGTVMIPDTTSPLLGAFTVNTGGTLSTYAIDPTGPGSAINLNGGTLDVQTLVQPHPPSLHWTSGTLIDETDTNIPVGGLMVGQNLQTGTASNSPSVLIGDTFSQTGGTYTNYGSTIVDNPNSSVLGSDSATYELTSGILNISGTTHGGGDLIIGTAGTGEFIQTGGSATVSGVLELSGSDPFSNLMGGAGTYNLSGSSGGTLTVNDYESVGYIGAGSFEQSGNSSNVTPDLFLGMNQGASGSYSLIGAGMLTSGSEYIGLAGTGNFLQSGGANGVTNDLYLAGGVFLGQSYSSPGANSYELDGGTLAAGGNEYVGYAGQGAFTQTGGSNTVGQTLYVGGAPTNGSYGVQSNYTLSGTGTLTAATEWIGYSDNGSFVQTGGTNNVGTLNINYQYSNITGSYELDGGALNATNEVLNPSTYGNVSATFTQTGGTNTITGQLSVTGNESTYTLAPAVGKTPMLSAPTELIGNQGSFIQQGGTNTVGTLLQVGNDGGQSQYSLYSGTLMAPEELIGSGNSYDQFNQAGGTNTVSGSLIIDSGAYGLYGGTLTAPNTPGDFVNGARGTFTMGGGVENGYLQNFGQFAYDSGTFHGTLENDGTASIYGAFTAGGGIINNSTISVSSTASIYGASTTGLDNESEIDIVGGTIGGSSTLNDGLISGYGTINGSNFTNYGLVTQGAGNLTLSATGTNVNYANIDLASGRQFRLTGSTLMNEGTLALNGGIVTGTAALDNSVGGVITGPGSILSPTFLNDLGGTMQIGAGTLNVSHAFTNAGLISLTSATANLTGPGVTNTGTIQGVGNVGSTSLTNNGIIDAIGGTLSVNGSVTNPAAGEIFASTGNKVLITNGLATNAGLINLTGGTYDNNSHALSNTGEISGYGTVRTGGLTTSGSMVFAGGTSTVNGAVTQTGGTIDIYNPTTFTNGASINGGTFTTHEAQTIFAGSGLNIGGGTFHNDPSPVQTTNLNVASGGTLTGVAGSLYQVSGNVSNASTGFQLAAGGLEVVSGASNSHTFTWSVNSGLPDIGTLTIDSSQKVDFENGGNNDAALYVLSFQLAGGLGAASPAALQLDINNVLSGNLDIFYDPTNSANAYLDDKTYTIPGGGLIETEAAPEPGTWAMLLLGLGMLIGFRKLRGRVQR